MHPNEKLMRQVYDWFGEGNHPETLPLETVFPPHFQSENYGNTLFHTDCSNQTEGHSQYERIMGICNGTHAQKLLQICANDDYVITRVQHWVTMHGKEWEYQAVEIFHFKDGVPVKVQEFGDADYYRAWAFDPERPGAGIRPMEDAP